MKPENLEEQLEILKNGRIYFGHQSVGGNIIDGLVQINQGAKELNIVNIDVEQEYPDSYFLHSLIGKNEDPGSKCDQFITKADSVSELVDVAMFKFCYIDINHNTDVISLFEKYKSTLKQVRDRYPTLKIVHITAPIRHCQEGWTITLREMLGRQNRSKLDNIKRNEYNDLLRGHYAEELIFDLAYVESTYPDGSRSFFDWNDKKYENLVREYTNDGGHLSKMGQAVVATELVKVLSNVLKDVDEDAN